MMLFGICSIITLWCAGFTVYLAVPHSVDGWKDFPQCVHFAICVPINTFLSDFVIISLLSTNKTFRDIVISVAGTYGLYLFGSLLHFEPWHMITSFVQYMFLLPSCKSLIPVIPQLIAVANRVIVHPQTSTFSVSSWLLSRKVRHGRESNCVCQLVMYAMCNLHDVTWSVCSHSSSNGLKLIIQIRP